LRFARSTGIQDEKIEKRALDNIRQTVENINGFRKNDGGISYWSSGDADPAVTAYALAFLVEASAITKVNKEDLASMVSWLEKHQASDGRWMPRNIGSALADRQALLVTSTVARALAAAKKNGIDVKSGTLGGAYHNMAALTDTLDEPYMLANFILAALDSGDEALLKNAVARLAPQPGMCSNEGRHWELESNSPFYGWGTAGRYETTGLVISALSEWRSLHKEAKELDPLIRCGLTFLLRHRGHNGYLNSSQSTLRAMSAMADASVALGGFGNQSGTLEIRVDDRPVKTITVPADAKAMDPIIVDLSAFLSSEGNVISLHPSADMKASMVLLSFTHWMPWRTQPRTSPELRLEAKFDKLEMRTGDLVRCSIKAERVGFRGYGMMIAEIGLPPGVEVDRASLESLLEDETRGIERYEVLPDRVLFYLWPKAGGASFQFSLSARMPMNAKSEPSILYDYNNPEALSEVLPSKWIVR